MILTLRNILSPNPPTSFKDCCEAKDLKRIQDLFNQVKMYQDTLDHNHQHPNQLSLILIQDQGHRIDLLVV